MPRSYPSRSAGHDRPPRRATLSGVAVTVAVRLHGTVPAGQAVRRHRRPRTVVQAWAEVSAVGAVRGCAERVQAPLLRRALPADQTPARPSTRSQGRGDRPSRAWHAVRTCTYRLSCVRPSRWALRWLAPLSLRRRPDTSQTQPANPSIRSAGSTDSARSAPNASSTCWSRVSAGRSPSRWTRRRGRRLAYSRRGSTRSRRLSRGARSAGGGRGPGSVGADCPARGAARARRDE